MHVNNENKANIAGQKKNVNNLIGIDKRTEAIKRERNDLPNIQGPKEERRQRQKHTRQQMSTKPTAPIKGNKQY